MLLLSSQIKQRPIQRVLIPLLNIESPVNLKMFINTGYL